MATQNPKISVYIPPDVEDCLRAAIKDWDKKDKNGKPIINKSKIIVDILKTYFGIESSDTSLATVNNRLVKLENDFRSLEAKFEDLMADYKEKVDLEPRTKEDSSLPLLELIKSIQRSTVGKINPNAKVATTQELLQLLEEVEPAKDWNYEKLRRIRRSKANKLPFKVGDYEIDWLGKETTEPSGQHLWKVVYIGKGQPLSIYTLMN
jgi:hypothetical protein